MSDRYDLTIRPAQRTLGCRGCNKSVYPGERVLYTYSHLNRGQHIYFCMECFEHISSMYHNMKEEDTDVSEN